MGSVDDGAGTVLWHGVWNCWWDFCQVYTSTQAKPSGVCYGGLLRSRQIGTCVTSTTEGTFLDLAHDMDFLLFTPSASVARKNQ